MFLTLINESHDAKRLHLLDLANNANGSANLADVQRIVVTALAGIRVLVLGIFPGLSSESRRQGV